MAQPTSPVQHPEQPAETLSVRPLVVGASLGIGILRHDASFNVYDGGDSCGAFLPATHRDISAELFFETPAIHPASLWLTAGIRYREFSADLTDNVHWKEFYNGFE